MGGHKPGADLCLRKTVCKHMRILSTENSVITSQHCCTEQTKTNVKKSFHLLGLKHHKNPLITFMLDHGIIKSMGSHCSTKHNMTKHGCWQNDTCNIFVCVYTRTPPAKDVYMLCSINIFKTRLQSTATSKSPFTISTVNTIDKYLQLLLSTQRNRARISEYH